MKYKETQSKFRKIFEKNKENLSKLHNKKNQVKPLPVETPILKTGQVLFDSDWQGFTPDSIVAPVSSTQATDKGYALINFGQDVDINVNEEMLAYLEYAMIFKAPGYRIVPSVNIISTNWFGSVFRVYGDSTLVFYGGPPQFGAVSNIHTLDSTLTEHGISFSNTKKAFFGDLVETDTTNHTGYIKRIFVTVSRTEDTCLTNDDTETFSVDYFDTNGQANFQHDLTSITSTGFTATGTTTITTFENIGTEEAPICQQNTSTLLETRSISFDSVESYTITMTQVPNIGNGFTNTITILSDDIDTFDFEFVGRHVYYDSNKKFRITSDGTFHLSPLPTNSGGSPDVTYTTITLTRNEFPDVDIITEQVEELAHAFPERGIWKLSKSDDPNKLFKVGFFTQFFLEIPLVPEQQSFPQWEDVYSGTNFVTLTHDHHTTEKTRYVPEEFPDIIGRLIICVSNPFNYKENKKYKITKSDA